MDRHQPYRHHDVRTRPHRIRRSQPTGQCCKQARQNGRSSVASIRGAAPEWWPSPFPAAGQTRRRRWFASGINWRYDQQVRGGDIRALAAAYNDLGAGEELSHAMVLAATKAPEPLVALVP